MERLVATARVEVVLEVNVRDSWGGDCPIDQVHRQAKEAARIALHHLLSKGSAAAGAGFSVKEFRIPQVILREEEK
jgi:hypothetical protein